MIATRQTISRAGIFIFSHILEVLILNNLTIISYVLLLNKNILLLQSPAPPAWQMSYRRWPVAISLVNNLRKQVVLPFRHWFCNAIISPPSNTVSKCNFSINFVIFLVSEMLCPLIYSFLLGSCIIIMTLFSYWAAQFQNQTLLIYLLIVSSFLELVVSTQLVNTIWIPTTTWRVCGKLNDGVNLSLYNFTWASLVEKFVTNSSKYNLIMLRLINCCENW